MDGSMILVLVLCAGVIALLAWFEISSRRNEAKAASTLARSDLESLKKKSQSEVESNTHSKKAV